MHMSVKTVTNSIQRQQKTYLFLGALLVLGIIAGSIYVFCLSEVDRTLLVDEIHRFFETMRSLDNLSYGSSFLNSLLTNLFYVFGVWFLGISIIGLPFILFLLLMKGFVFGFSVFSIISIYGLKGVLGAITYVFPHQLLFLLLSLVLTFYAFSFSIKLFSALFLKRNINWKEAMHKYLKILLLSIVIALITSLFEVFISPFLIQFFTQMI